MIKQTEQKQQKKPLIILTGPTASGKTALSIELAKRTGGAIISADSMQAYKYMDIGSAKIMPDEMQGIKHYLIDEFLPDEAFNVVTFKQRAEACMQEIYAAGKIPILAGGTGFYIQAVLYDIDFSGQNADGECRRKLEQLADLHGVQYLYEQLKEAGVDPSMIRLSVGIEDVRDIIGDLEHALG